MEWFARPRKVFEALRRSQPLREHLMLSAIIVIGRAALHLAGLRFNLDLSWIFLSDLRDLRERLWETLYYAHSFPPGMNLLTGVILKVGGPHTEVRSCSCVSTFPACCA